MKIREDAVARPLLFNTEAMRGIIEGRKFQTRRPVKTHLLRGEHPHNAKCPHGVVGDLIYPQETWRLDDAGRVRYLADNPDAMRLHKWNTGFHLGRERSRFTLLLTDVRAERVRDISVADIRAEGLRPSSPLLPNETAAAVARLDWRLAWGGIYGDESWLRNDWAWALTFKVIRDNVDAVLRRRVAA